jgi:polysaccharide biosynthesis transport protein
LEDEIDLRQYVMVLVRSWQWIVGVAVVAAVVALLVSFLTPPTYQATALVVVTKPRYVMQFDPRFRTLDNIQAAYKAYPELATSDALLQSLLAQESRVSTSGRTLVEMRNAVKAELGGDPSLIRLSVQSKDPNEAAALVNVWAELFVTKANEIYGSQGSEQQTFFERQLAQTETEVDQSQQRLIAFQSHNRAVILRNQLESLTLTQATYLTEQRAVISVLPNVQGLREQLASQPGQRAVTTADQITVLLLQAKAFGLFGAQESTPIQLQFNSDNPSASLTVNEQIVLLDTLANVLERKAATIEAQLSALEPQLLAVQQQLEEAQAEEERLLQNKLLVHETYMTLARKVDEARIGADDTGGEVQLASRAAVPERPLASKRVMNTGLAFAAGLVVSTFIVLAIGWWREASSEAKLDPRAQEVVST